MRFRYRLMGEIAHAIFGDYAVGRCIDEALPEPLRSERQIQLEQAYRHGRCYVALRRVPNQHQSSTPLLIGLFPFRAAPLGQIFMVTGPAQLALQ
ncbi:MAG: hypothetical protein ACFB22_14920 [Rhodothalassiaceae bacterium]